MQIIVTSVRPFSKGALKGFVSISLPAVGLNIHDCRWFEKDGREWLGFPGKEFSGQGGDKKWSDLVSFIGGTDKQAWQRAAVDAIYKHLGAGGGPLPIRSAFYPPPVKRQTQLATPEVHLGGKDLDEDLPF